MFSLRHRRLRGDMTEAFKMIHGIDKINVRKLLCVNKDGRTRAYGYCLKIRRYVNSDIGVNYFTTRIKNYWNQLPDIANP